MNRRQDLCSIRHVAAWAVLLVCLTGCESKPQAPMLGDFPVYKNPNEGISFLVPDGWLQTSNTSLPPGDLEGETFLVRYKIKNAEAGANLNVICMQETSPVNLAEHHAAASFGVEKWPLTGEAEKLEFGGKPAERMLYQAKIGKVDMAKEVICFRNRGRVYSFVAMYAASDLKTAQQIRRAMESIRWES
jgi:hypothetical protein